MQRHSALVSDTQMFVGNTWAFGHRSLATATGKFGQKVDTFQVVFSRDSLNPTSGCKVPHERFVPQSNALVGNEWPHQLRAHPAEPGHVLYAHTKACTHTHMQICMHTPPTQTHTHTHTHTRSSCSTTCCVITDAPNEAIWAATEGNKELAVISKI